ERLLLRQPALERAGRAGAGGAPGDGKQCEPEKDEPPHEVVLAAASTGTPVCVDSTQGGSRLVTGIGDGHRATPACRCPALCGSEPPATRARRRCADTGRATRDR